MSFHILRHNIISLSLSPSFSDNAHLSVVLISGKTVFFFTVIDFISLNNKNEKGTIVKQG